MNEEQKQQAGITDINDVLVAARQGIQPWICEQIHARALGLAFSQYLSSTHEEGEYEAILNAISNDRKDVLEYK